MTHQEAAAAPDVITGTVFLFDVKVYALIDPGSMHSFISSTVASCLNKEPESLSKKLAVRTPIGEVLTVQTVYRDYAV